MSKLYGLIIPEQQKKKQKIDESTTGRRKAVEKASIFSNDSSSDTNDDDDGGRPPLLKSKTPSVNMGPSLMERRLAKSIQEKALAEDPTIFQYDELYDDLNEQRDAETLAKSKEPKKPKYITKLLQTAERRKLENELRVERQVQKEREAEGEEFKDKEAFVTSAYRKKLEEMRKLEEENARNDYLEAIGDVTKQKDLDGFYRHIYEQKLNIEKKTNKPQLEPKITTSGNGEANSFVVARKSITSNKQRTYRKRSSPQADEENEEKQIDQPIDEKSPVKAHLTNNIDADSDFSIDDSDSSSASEDETDTRKTVNKINASKASTDNDLVKKDKTEVNSKLKKTSNSSLNKEANTTTISDTPAHTIAINLDSLKKEKVDNTKDKSKDQDDSLVVNDQTQVKQEVSENKPKRDKSEIWRKRTVGKVFEEALLRYQQRRSQHLKSDKLTDSNTTDKRK